VSTIPPTASAVVHPVPADGGPAVSGPVQLAALVRVVGAAHARRDALCLAAALEDVASAATSWGAQVRRHTAAAAAEDPFVVDDVDPSAGYTRHGRARAAERVARATSGRAASPRRADLASGEGIRAGLLA
jgi:hypothetical protein